MLPCYWIYARVGAELLARSSPDPLYARWIAMYGGDEFQAVVDSVLALTDRVGAEVSAAERALMREHFTTTVALRVDVLGRRLPPRDLAGLSDRRGLSAGPAESGTTKCSSAPTTDTTIAPEERGQEPVHVERQPEPVGDPADQQEQQRVHHQPDQAQGQHVERAADHLDQRLQHGVDQPEDQRDADQGADPGASSCPR